MAFWDKGFGKVLKTGIFRGIDTVIPGAGLIAETISDKVFVKGSGLEANDLLGGVGKVPHVPLVDKQKQDFINANLKAGMPIGSIAKVMGITEAEVKAHLKVISKGTNPPSEMQLKKSGVAPEEVKETIVEKITGFVKENLIAVVSGVGVIGFGLIIRFWQLSKPKSKRWGMFK